MTTRFGLLMAVLAESSLWFKQTAQRGQEVKRLYIFPFAAMHVQFKVA